MHCCYKSFPIKYAKARINNFIASLSFCCVTFIGPSLFYAAMYIVKIEEVKGAFIEYSLSNTAHPLVVKTYQMMRNYEINFYGLMQVWSC